MAGFWGRSRRAQEDRGRQDALAAQDTALAQRAATALVAADERLRLTDDELGFATAELGESATRELAEAVAAVRQHLGEAFRLHQLNVDDIPDTQEELRERNARIVQLADWAVGLLEERTGDLERRVSKVRQAPAVVESVQSEAASTQGRLESVRAILDRLARRYSADALRQVSANVTEAEELLAFAGHGLEVAARRRDSGQLESSTVALEAATEGVRRSTTLLDAVESFEIEALRAESTLAAVVADSRGDIVTARSAPATPAVTAAVAALQAALDALPTPGTPSDPFADLTRLRAANTGLDEAVAFARERAARPVPSPAQLATAVQDAEQQLAVARDVIAGHRGWIGADARTRLAEAERALTDVHRAGSDEDSRERALALARRSADLASEALRLAQVDIDSGRGGWQDQRRRAGGVGGVGGPGGGYGRSNDLGGLLGGVLGGMVLGEVFEDFFD